MSGIFPQSQILSAGLGRLCNVNDWSADPFIYHEVS